LSVIGLDNFVYIQVQGMLPNFRISNADRFRNPETNCWPEIDEVMGGALRE